MPFLPATPPSIRRARLYRAGCRPQRLTVCPHKIRIDGDATKAVGDLKAGQTVRVTFSGNSVSEIELVR
jgi:hypothetical protein